MAPCTTFLESCMRRSQCRGTAAACIPSTDALSAPAALRRGVGSGALLKISAISRNAASASWARLHDNEQVLHSAATFSSTSAASMLPTFASFQHHPAPTSGSARIASLLLRTPCAFAGQIDARKSPYFEHQSVLHSPAM